MLRLIKYLKPYLPMLLVAIVLLFVQANSDLALPDYMSRIVNNGIQQGGIESSLPMAIRQSEMNKLTFFMSTEQKALVLQGYDLVNSQSADYSKYVTQYPILASEPIYLFNELDGNKATQLKSVMTSSEVIVSFLKQAMADPSKVAALSSSLGFDVSKIQAGSDVFTLISQLPSTTLTMMSGAINQKIIDMGEQALNQSAVTFVKSEYKALGMDTTALQTNYILRTGLSMLLLTLLSVACTIVVGYLSARTASGLSRDLRNMVFQRVESFSYAELDKFSTASLITRTTNDVTQIQMVVIMMMRMVIYAPIIGVGGVMRAIGKSTNMWWLIGLAVIVLLGLILTIFSITLPKFKIMQKLIDRLNLVTRENLSGMMVIRAFNMQDFEEKRFDNANQDLTSNSLFVNRIMVLMMPLMNMVMNGLSLMIIWVGAHQVAQSSLQVGDMMAFMQYAMQIMFSFLMMSLMFIILPRASVSADRIADVLETEPLIKDPEKPLKFHEPFNSTIEFRNVSFRYPDAEEDVLHEISFTASPGQTTAFIGTTGSGKSTIVSLIPRFFDPTSGQVLIDGMDIRKVTQSDLRDKIGCVPQKSNLFTGTIESNLCYADENASDDQLLKAAETAQASGFIQSLADGLQSPIAQGGSNVSGGQRQRLAIARALVKNAPVYIFDDSFSNLDFKTDAALRKALKQTTGGSTLLVITQRISTIMNSEQIIVMDEGRIVGKGTHTELLKSCEVYRGIATAQLSSEELR
jgi:ATP-binding cassette, subfamily B, multidrug efflux pump